MITVYSDEEGLTESDFLIREVGLHLHLVSPNEESFAELNIAGRLWIATTKPHLWRKIISSSPNQSIVLFYLGNELYKTDELDFIYKSKSIFRFFQYSPTKNPRILNLISAFFGSLLDSGWNFPRDLPVYLRNFRTGIQVLVRLNSGLNVEKLQVYEIPQGYSLAFAKQLEALIPELGSSQSLIDNVTLIWENFRLDYCLHDLSFVGQTGTLRRTRIIQLARYKYGRRAQIVVRSGFGGNDRNVDDAYLKSLLHSKSCLIPFGNFNNYNHRYCESLIVNRIPLVASNNLTDPNENYYWTKRYPLILRDSYRWILYKFQTYDKFQLQQILNEAKEVEFEKILHFRDSILECQREQIRELLQSD